MFHGLPPGRYIDCLTRCRAFLSLDWQITHPALQYDVPELKDLALSRIRAELENCDVVRETFSRFASKYVHPIYAIAIGINKGS